MPVVTTTGTNLNSTVGAAYNVTLTVSGGIAPYTWAIASGSLPSCLTLNSGTGAITGTITAACAGNYTVTFSASDSGSPNKLTAQATLNFTISAPVVTFSPTLPQGAVGTAYSGSVAASGVVGTTTYSIASGTLPPDLTLNTATGAVTGTPKAADVGTATFKVKVLDQFGDTATSGNLTITVSAPSITFTPTLTAGTVGTAYSGSVRANGAVGTLAYSIASGALPPDLALSTATGAIAGTPTLADIGTATFMVKVVDQYGDTATSASQTITISAPTITFTPTLPAGTVGTAYTGGVIANGAAGTTTYSIVSGTLPPDLSQNTSTGAITGTPKAADVGTATFTVKVVDQYGDIATSSGQSVTISAPTISFTPTLPAGAVGFAYSGGVVANGAVGTVTYSIASGALPPDLALNPATGAITGTPKAADIGTATFTISVTDQFGDTATSSSQSITVAAPTALALPGTLTPASATDGAAYSGSAAAAGGVAPLTYSIISGSLPAWATLDPATGAITGTPAGIGTFNFTVKVVDNYGDTPSTQAYSLTVNPGVATHYSVTATSSTTISAGGTVNLTVTALDVNNATATGYAGTVHFTSTDAQASLSANSALVAGVGSFSATLKTTGSQSITATDTTTATITGTLTGITVNGGAASKLLVSSSSPQTAGTAFNVTVTAQDTYGNTATGYTGTIHFTKSDSGAGSTLPGSYTFVAGDNGVHIFTGGVTLVTAGSQTVAATDTVNGSITGTTGSITINAATASHLAVSAPSSTPAGSPIGVTVTAKDNYGNTATGYTGTVHLTSTDGSAVIPSDSTLTSGTKIFSVTLKTAGSQTVTATDTVNSPITGTSNVITVNPGSASRFAVFTTSPQTAGTAFNFTVMAEDSFNNVIPGYAGTVHFTSTDGQAVLPANTTLSNGSGTFSATLKTAGNQTITATDTVNSSVTGSTSNITVNPGAASSLTLSAPPSVSVGLSFNVTVTAKDALGNIATGYAGTVQFTSSDGQAVLPANSTLTSGTGTFSVTLKTIGSQNVTATDTVNGSLTNTAGITVNPATATHFLVSAPGSSTAGGALSVTVTALDAFNNTASGYTGTVHFTKTDSGASSAVPSNYTFVAGDNGVHTFTNGVTLVTAGSQTVTATDTVSGSINGTSGTITVSGGSATKLFVSSSSPQTAGAAFNITVTAQDTYGNTATGYSGTVHLTSTDGSAVLGADSTLTNGIRAFSVTLRTAGSQTVTATDTGNGSITGTTSSITVNAAAASTLAVSASGSASAGGAFSVTVTARDAYGNTATGYTGTIHFTKSDSGSGSAVPANFTFAPADQGVHTFTNGVTLVTTGSQTLTATDTVTGTITGTSSTINVSAAAASHFAVSATSPQTAGTAFNITVTAQDSFGNTTTSYSGTVHFTSTYGSAVLPANSTLTNGTGTFAVTLKNAGSQTVTATDTVTGSITGTTPTITVNGAAATNLQVAAPGFATAGSPVTVSVTAVDAYGNTANGYTGTVHFTSTDGAASLPANSTLINGVGSFQATLKTTGSQIITATDTVTGSLTGVTTAIIVSPGAATRLVVSAPGSATAGTAFNVTITAQDNFNNTITGYSGTVHFTSTDGSAVLPANSTLTYGTGTFSVTLKSAGIQTVAGTDTVSGSITGTSGTITVNPATANHLVVVAPASATDSVAFNFTVTADDAFNNTATGYTGTVHFTSNDAAATLPANATLTSGTGTFSATLNTPGSTLTITATDTVTASINGTSANINVGGGPTGGVSGKISVLNFACGSAGSLPQFTLSINTTPTATTVTTDSSGNFSFSGIPSGTYTITPSMTGPNLPEYLFYPSSIANVTINNGTVTGQNFSVELGYTITGTVNYSGSATGPIFVELMNSNCGGGAANGTTLTAGSGSFTIRGVAPGAYLINAWRDKVGNAQPNASDPVGTLNNIQVTTSNLSGQNVTLTDPSPVSLTGSTPNFGLAGASANGAVFNFDPLHDNNGVETATGYTMQWSTSNTTNSTGFTSVAGSYTFPAAGTNGANIWILNNANASGLISGGTYYFLVQASAGSSLSNLSSVLGPVTLNNPSAGNTVSGQVTWNGTATGPLYVGFYDQNTGQAYATQVGTKASPPSSPANYSVQVPTGTNYFFFGIIDNNNNGIVDAGDISDVKTNDSGLYTANISGTAGLNLDLTSIGNATTRIRTQFVQSTSPGDTSTSYSLDIDVGPGIKQPIKAVLTSGPNVINPVDMGLCGDNCSNGGFEYLVGIGNAVPQVGQTYTFNLTYSDNSTESVNGTVNSVLDASALATLISPTGTGVGSTPNFSWTYPANPANYAYSFNLCCDNGSVWQIPGQHTNNNTFTNTQITPPLVWGADPTNPSNIPSPSALIGGNIYTWSIQSKDSFGNTATAQMNFSTTAGPLTLPNPNPNSLPSAVVNVAYNGSVNVSGGIGPYTWNVTGLPSDNLGYATSNNGATLNITGTPTSTTTGGSPVTFQASATDATNTTVGPKTYTIVVNPFNPVSLPPSANIPLGPGIAGMGYGQSISAGGGSGGTNYTWVVNSTPIPTSATATSVTNGDGLVFKNNGNNTLSITGTPTNAQAVSLTIQVTDTLHAGNTTTQTYSVTIGSGPTNANNSRLNGTYVCYLQGYNDSNNSRWATLSSVVLNGSGSISSGVWDSNSRNFPSAISGTLTGSYNVNADNNGLATWTSTVTAGGSGSNNSTYAIALTGSGSPAQEFRMTSADDVGSTPSGTHGTADCYLANNSAFAASTLSGSGFAFSMTGESGSGVAKAMAGRFDGGSSGSVTGGYADSAVGGSTAMNSGSVANTSTYTTPDATTGRATLSLVTAGGTGNFALYVIDANRAFILQTDSSSGLQSGIVHKQQQSSYSASNVNGNMALYFQGIQFANAPSTTSTGFYSEVFQGSSNGAGSVSLNQSYENVNGAYLVNQSVGGGSAPLSFDSGNPGRVVVTTGNSSTTILYLYDTNSGFEVSTGGNPYPVEWGYLEPQTQTTFTNAAVAGNYMNGNLPITQAGPAAKVGQYNLNSVSSSSTGNISIGARSIFAFDRPVTLNYFFDNTVPGTGSLTTSGTDGTASCEVINSTRIVCTSQGGAPLLFILQQ
jgi:hypothetical protein